MNDFKKFGNVKIVYEHAVNQIGMRLKGTQSIESQWSFNVIDQVYRNYRKKQIMIHQEEKTFDDVTFSFRYYTSPGNILNYKGGENHV